MNMPEYTPSSIEVLCRYQEWAGGSSTDETRRAEFDRWLAARDRENRAIGWDEALVHVWKLNDPAYTVISDTDSTHPILTRHDVDQALGENPYRGDNR